MRYDSNACHPFWTRETDDVFKNFIRQAQIENICDEHGRVDIGQVTHLLVTAYSEGRIVVTPPKQGLKVVEQAAGLTPAPKINGKKKAQKQKPEEPPAEVAQEAAT